MRSPASCRQRRACGDGFACGILSDLFGSDDPGLVGVSVDACEACCRSYEPSAEELNPVVASLVYGAARRVVERGGSEACSIESARELEKRAFLRLRMEDHAPRVPYERVLEELSRSCRCVEAIARDEPGRVPCDWCRAWGPASRDDPSSVYRQLPAPASPAHKADKIKSWAVGVVTSPRRLPTLGTCLDGILRAGWSTPHIFCDGDVEVDTRHAHLPITRRQPGTGAWPNYYLSLIELYMREPHADAFLLFEDDALLYDRENVREYLEEVLWPAENTAFVSLYSSMAYTGENDQGWIERRKPWVWGALAFVFPRESMLEFVSHPDVVRHRATEDGHLNADVLAGGWADGSPGRVFHPVPSLVQHIGETSTVFEGSPARAERRATRFVGDPFFRDLIASFSR